MTRALLFGMATLGCFVWAVACSSGDCPEGLVAAGSQCAPTPCGVTCGGDTPFCDASTKSCVGCLSDADCGDRLASHCSESGQCAACADDGQCAHLGETPYCVGEPGRCSPCTDKDPATCEEGVCDVRIGSCVSEAEPGSRAACEPCVGTAECQEGHVCVRQEVASLSLTLGSYCLPEAEVVEGEEAAVCTSGRVYLLREAGATTVEGETADICVPRLTNCVALADTLDLTTTCSDPGNTSICGVPGLADGQCEASLGNTLHCTVPCDRTDDCPPTWSCAASAPRVCVQE